MVCCSNNTPEKMHWSLPDTKIDIDATKEVMTIDSDFFGVCPICSGKKQINIWLMGKWKVI